MYCLNVEIKRITKYKPNLMMFDNFVSSIFMTTNKISQSSEKKTREGRFDTILYYYFTYYYFRLKSNIAHTYWGAIKLSISYLYADMLMLRLPQFYPLPLDRAPAEAQGFRPRCPSTCDLYIFIDKDRWFKG